MPYRYRLYLRERIVDPKTGHEVFNETLVTRYDMTLTDIIDYLRMMYPEVANDLEQNDSEPITMIREYTIQDHRSSLGDLVIKLQVMIIPNEC